MTVQTVDRWAELSAAEREVLEAVFWERDVSRSALAAQMGYSKSKSSAAVSGLMMLGALERKARASTGGRRAEGLSLSGGLGVIAAVDLGATSLSVGLLTPTLSVLESLSEDIDVRQGPGPVMARVKAILRQLLVVCGVQESTILALGMGVPGPVESHSGLLVNPPIMPGWEGFSIRDDLAGMLGAPVYVDNDVNVAALAELWHAERKLQNFFVIKVGTGIGCGIVCNGAVYHGMDGAAGDVGHILVDPLGPRCHCGNVGCVEAMAAGPAIAREATLAAQTGESPLLAEWLHAQGRLDPPDVARAGREGDPVANAIIQKSGLLIGQMLAALVNFFNPSHIVLTGGITRMGPLWLASIRQSVYQRSLALSTRHIEIRPSVLGEQGGLIGAGALAMLSSIRVESA